MQREYLKKRPNFRFYFEHVRPSWPTFSLFTARSFFLHFLPVQSFFILHPDFFENQCGLTQPLNFHLCYPFYVPTYSLQEWQYLTNTSVSITLPLDIKATVPFREANPVRCHAASPLTFILAIGSLLKLLPRPSRSLLSNLICYFWFSSNFRVSNIKFTVNIFICRIVHRFR